MTITQKARNHHLSVDELLRRAIALDEAEERSLPAVPLAAAEELLNEDLREILSGERTLSGYREKRAQLDHLLTQLSQSTARANAALDDTLSFIEVSDTRIAEMDKNVKMQSV
ncbi:hypothetical protein NVV93_08595 [Pseudomonas sp. LS44]|uniref:hypothetical protein n=1 Tax=Pseudomonas sp. LS44 TaxID=1357074 RepID=UPI00215A2EB7|nr:hypothetical protein [Pseudomonas sp. LS44]UVE19417.1 hypothetical protein NVV93_08595 [Pseudomonas sp. LS44]